MKSENGNGSNIGRSLTLFILFIIINSYCCDIPVHCLKSQITGEWTFYLTKAYKQTKESLYKLGCSHTIPSNEKNAYKAEIDERFFTQKIFLKLKNNDIAEMINIESPKNFLTKDENNENSKILTGYWTMVYDEGFDINIQDFSFFAFSKYAPNPNQINYFSTKKEKWVSMCYSTLLGWYHQGDSWGCFYGKKSNEFPETITNGEVLNKMFVVENTVKKKDDTEFDFMRFKQERIKSKEKKNELKNYTAISHNYNETVNLINSVQSLWTAEVYDEFSKMSLQELNKYAGRRSNINRLSIRQEKDESLDYYPIQENLKNLKNLNYELTSYKKYNITEVDSQKSEIYKNFGKNFIFKSITSKLKMKKKTKSTKNLSYNKIDENFPDLPKNFKKWSDYMPAIRNQGKCGSCYAVSSLNMLESRLKIHQGINEELSLNHILNCSVYNQGCEGGYAYLVMKFGKELELIPKRCERSSFEEFQCSMKSCRDVNVQYDSYKVTNFGYLGGSYGKCNEELLMRELYKNGPIVVSFEPDYHFMMYKRGIYKSIQTNWMNSNLPKPEWEKVDHSVTLVGWGFDEIHQQKYWLILNSWGKHWGEDGYFRMVRGEDHLGIESICEIGNIMPNI